MIFKFLDICKEEQRGYFRVEFFELGEFCERVTVDECLL